MNRRQIGLGLMCVAIGAGAINLNVWADDSAASIAAGGLVPRRETRITMAKEVLSISPTKVVVDYDFRNDSEEDVTTEVAFPIPPYTNDINGPALALESFSDFKLFIDGRRTPFGRETKALLKGKDVTKILISDRIDAATFGHYDEKQNIATDLSKLASAEQKRLEALGLFDEDPPTGNWTAHVQYHWTQSFPSHSTVRIRHEYTPVVGFTQVSFTAVDALLGQVQSPESVDEIEILRGFCADHGFLSSLAQGLHRSQSSAETQDAMLTSGVSYPHWVDFVLTSANTWKQPIEDFTLIIEWGKSVLEDKGRLISFCSPKNTAVQKVDANHFQVHLTNFVPESELHIGFFDLPKPGKTAQEKSKGK